MSPRATRCVFVAAAATVALLGGCSFGDDPYVAVGGLDQSCIEGHFRDPGPGCTVPQVDGHIDGYLNEFDDERLLAYSGCSDCLPGEVETLKVARDDDGTLLFAMETSGAPVADETALYEISMSSLRSSDDTRAPRNATIFVGGDRGVTLEIEDIEVKGLPVETAFGPDGLEVKIPTSWLPFDGASDVQASTLFFDEKEGVYSGRQFGFYRPHICWDPTKADNPCAFF